MSTYIALLRAVNLGGATQVSMSALRGLLAQMGFRDVRSLLQSGNLVFRQDDARASDLEHRLEERSARSLGLRTDFFVRTEAEWRRIIERNPFPREAARDPSHLVVTALRTRPSADAWEALRAAIRGPERFVGAGRQAYIVYPDGIGRSKLTARLIEDTLGTRGTSRNWNTVTKLGALASS